MIDCNVYCLSFSSVLILQLLLHKRFDTRKLQVACFSTFTLLSKIQFFLFFQHFNNKCTKICFCEGVFDLNKFTNGDMCRIHGIVYETLMEDEENQVRGFVHFADGQGVGFAYLTLFTIKEAVRIVKNGEVLKINFTG